MIEAWVFSLLPLLSGLLCYENCKYCVHISKEKKLLQNYINFVDVLKENRELSFPSERFYRDQVKAFKGGRIRIKLLVCG